MEREADKDDISRRDAIHRASLEHLYLKEKEREETNFRRSIDAHELMKMQLHHQSIVTRSKSADADISRPYNSPARIKSPSRTHSGMSTELFVLPMRTTSPTSGRYDSVDRSVPITKNTDSGSRRGENSPNSKLYHSNDEGPVSHIMCSPSAQVVDSKQTKSDECSPRNTITGSALSMAPSLLDKDADSWLKDHDVNNGILAASYDGSDDEVQSKIRDFELVGYDGDRPEPIDSQIKPKNVRSKKSKVKKLS